MVNEKNASGRVTKKADKGLENIRKAPKEKEKERKGKTKRKRKEKKRNGKITLFSNSAGRCKKKENGIELRF